MLAVTPSHARKIYQEAIDDVVKAGVVVVVAAGNNQRNVALTTPANCQNVIVVGAIDRQADRAWYSNYGDKVDVMAPGGDTNFTGNGVLSLYNSGLSASNDASYKELQGTSMAAPQVTGLIGLSIAVNPHLNPAEREALLKQSARDFPTGSNCIDFLCGAGIIDAGAFLRAVQNGF